MLFPFPHNNAKLQAILNNSFMARIISGTARSINLEVPKSGTRPVTDRAKSALFSMITDLIPDAEVLDLFAGSGSLGIEALSRGAKHATFIDSEDEAIECIHSNLRKTKLLNSATVIQDTAENFCLAPNAKKFDIVFLDPPYLSANESQLQLTANCLKAESVAVLKHSPKFKVEETKELQLIESRKYGQNVISFYIRK